jgi:hypothetical protein
MVEVDLSTCKCICDGVTETAKVFEKSQIQNALEIGVIVLIVLLIIVGLIIGFNKLRDKDDTDGPHPPYY